MVQSVMDVSELQETVDDLKSVAGSVESMGDTLNTTKKTISDPLGAAADAAKAALNPIEDDSEAEEPVVETGAQAGAPPSATSVAKAISPEPEAEVEPTIAPPPDGTGAREDSPAAVDSGSSVAEDTDQGDPETAGEPESISAEETND